MIVTVARYRTITGDTTTGVSAVVELIERAVDHLEEDLRRPLAETERTELVWIDRAGWVWPAATPLTVVPTGWQREGNGLRPPPTGALIEPFTASDTLELTYTGGWVERTANPAAANRLPASIERDLAWVAHALGNPDDVASKIPAGATAVRLGDISVSFGPHGAATPGDMTVRWSRATRRWKRRTP